MSAWSVKPETSSGGEGQKFEKPPAGNHAAVLVGIFDMGTQEIDYQGKSKWARSAFFVWELVLAKMTGTTGVNHVIGRDLTVSLFDKATLRKFIEARTGKKLSDDAEYDISQELGKPCMLNVILKNNYPKVDGVAGVPAGLPFPEAQRKPVAMTLDQFRAGEKIPEWVPWLYGRPLEEKIKECKELAKSKAMDFDALAAAHNKKPEDVIPF